MAESAPPKGDLPPNSSLKFLLDLGPLAVFFTVLAIWGIFPATEALMIATLVCVAASWALLKKVSVLALVTCASVLVFGSLTIYFKDPTFIKIKVTIINLLFASILTGSLLKKKPILKIVLGEAVQLMDEGWRILTLRWIGFFLSIAVLNEIVWRNFSDETWGAFKSFGVIGLTVLFMVSQVSVLMKYQIPADQNLEKSKS